MKKKNLIKTALLSSALLLGTGYAVINNRTLTATGTVPIAQKELDVKITKVESSNGGMSNVVIAEDGYSVTFDYGEYDGELKDAGITLTNNESDIDVNVYYDIVVVDEDGNGVGWNINCEIAPSTISADGADTFWFVFYDEGDILYQYETLTVTITFTASPKL